MILCAYNLDAFDSPKWNHRTNPNEPDLNICPLNWQESYGEDPFFSGKMGAAVIRGVQ